MEGNYKKLFEHLEHSEPPAGLSDRIMLAVSHKKASRALWTKTVASGVVSLIAIAAIVPSWLMVQSEIYKSGFSQFLSLLLSDTNTVLSIWKEFSLSLLESFPTVGAIAVLGSVFVFLISIRLFVGDLDKIIHQTQNWGNVKYNS